LPYLIAQFVPVGSWLSLCPGSDFGASIKRQGEPISRIQCSRWPDYADQQKYHGNYSRHHDGDDRAGPPCFRLFPYLFPVIALSTARLDKPLLLGFPGSHSWRSHLDPEEIPIVERRTLLILSPFDRSALKEATSSLAWRY
jgi:hypothetical protein